MKRGALYIRRKPYVAPVRHAERCVHCGQRYVNMSAHLSRCKALDKKPAPVIKPMAEIEAKLVQIAWKHGYSLEQLRDKGRAREACTARVECYYFLRSEHWSVSAIATYFNRVERTISAFFASPAARQRTQEYLRQWRANHKQGQAA